MPKGARYSNYYAPSLALSGPAKAEIVEIPSGASLHADVLETDFHESLFFCQKIETLIDNDGNIKTGWNGEMSAQEKTRTNNSRWPQLVERQYAVRPGQSARRHQTAR